MVGTRSVLSAALMAALVAGGLGCKSDDPTGQGGSLDGAGLETYMQANLGAANVMLDAANRLLLALQGMPQPDVTITPTAGGGTALVGMDFDGDGTTESLFSANMAFSDPMVGIASGATMTFDFTGDRVTGSGSAGGAPFGPTSFGVGGGTPGGPSATFTSATGIVTSLYDWSLTADLSTAIVGAGMSAASSVDLSGFGFVTVSSETQSVDLELFVEPDVSSATGFKVTVFSEEAGIFFEIP